ncbi:MAG: CAP domain-containing protein [Filimonas sp.]|nr:CAP domain-containing protein [Filimonas sp.]
MKKLLTAGRVIVLGFVLFAIACKTGSTSSSASPSKDKIIALGGMEDKILYYVNQHRKEVGRPPLQMLSVANTEASRHSANMASRKTGFGHSGFEDRVARIRQSAGAISAAAENVAYGQLSAKDVVNGWINSSGHRKNMEGNYTYTGIGVAKDKNGTIFFTQIFLSK